ncbi:MAG: extracellular solute-binding protein [Chloroflexi bacterium]|nr:extracellular solute-binding protein [Chloroflexota bacterium]
MKEMQRTGEFLKKGILITFIVLLAMGAACSAGSTEVAGTPAEPKNIATRAASSAEPWKEKWENTLAEARKEGKLLINDSGAGPEVRAVLTKVFRDKFGIDIEYNLGRSNELIVKIRTERNAGLYLVDLLLSGTGSPTTILKPEKIIDPLDPTLILPEVLNKIVWYRGDLPWVDDGHYQLAPFVSPKVPIFINTNLVKQGVITSYQDLLKPEWKGKLTINDPTRLGGGNSWFTAMVDLFGVDYLRKMAAQNVVLVTDNRLHADWVAQGKYPVGIAMDDDLTVSYMRAGAPIAFVVPKEGTWLSSGGAGISLVNKPPHPNAAKVFINWLLSKEGSTEFSRAHGHHSMREDVPTDFLAPEKIRKPGVEYYPLWKHDISEKKVPGQKLAAEIFSK